MLNKHEKDCCGCTACQSICPQNAISMEENAEGFKYPVINEKKCISCGLCEKVCAFENEISANAIDKIICAKRKSRKRRLSQSGGAFSVFAEMFLKKKYVVYGVTFADGRAAYERIDSLEEIEKLRGSKYVQADVGNVFEKVSEDILNNRYVLFSGNPCVIAGLLSYLKNKHIETSNLYTCDLICHGVPSPRIFRNYMDYINHRFGGITKFNFRDKIAAGWHSCVESFCSSERRCYISANYVNIFFSNLELRESCYYCPYATKNRISDLTVGDFWGIDSVNRKFNDNKGCSIIMINSNKGMSVWQETYHEFLYFESNYDNGKKKQQNLIKPTDKPAEVEAFWKDYKNFGFLETVKKYCNFSEDDYKRKGKYLIDRYIMSIKRRIHR